MSRRSLFRVPFGSQRSNGYETLPNSSRQHFYLFLSPLSDTLSWKIASLVRSEIGGMWVNTFTADSKYSGHKRDNLTQLFQMYRSKKLKNFSGQLFRPLKCTWNLDHFDKKYEPHTLNSLEVIYYQKRGYVNV